MTERRKWRSRDNAELGATLFACVLMVAMFAWVHFQGQKLDAQQKQINAQQQQLIAQQGQIGADRLFLVESCKRLQIVRVEDNVSHYADYAVYRVVYLESETALKLGLVSRAQQRADRRFLSQLRAAIAAKSWVPVTNCAQAINRHGSAYRPPRPVPFSKRLPPRSALVLPRSDFR